MSISAALVLYAVIWALCFLVALPIKIRSQGESGEVVQGTPSSAPAEPMLKTKLIWASIAAAAIWLPVTIIIASDAITMEDIDFFNLWGEGKYG